MAIAYNIMSITSDKNDKNIAPEDIITISVSITNTGSVAVNSAVACVMKTKSSYSGGELLITNIGKTSISIKSGQSKTYQIKCKALAVGEACDYWSGNPSYQNVFNTSFSTISYSDIEICISNNSKVIPTASSTSHKAAPSGTRVLSVRLSPVINQLAFYRCDVGGTENDEGEKLLSTIKLTLGNTSISTPVFELSLYNADTGEYTGQTVSTNVTAQSDLVHGITHSNKYINTFTVGRDANYYIEAKLEGTYEVATKIATISRAFANVHLSAAKKGGVAFGKFSSSTDTSPKFECEYPAYFDAGIFGVTDYEDGEIETGGTWRVGNDNAPIYRNVFVIPYTGNGSAVTGATISGFSKLVSLNGYCVRTSSGGSIPANFYYSSTNNSSAHVDGNGNIIVRSTSDGTFYIVVEYTKT